MQWKYILFYGVRTLRKTSKTNYVLFFVIRLRTLNRHEFLHAFLSSKFEFENIYSGVNFYEDIIIIFFFFFFFHLPELTLCVLLEKMQNLEP